jgi:hypothetical protein
LVTKERWRPWRGYTITSANNGTTLGKSLEEFAEEQEAKKRARRGDAPEYGLTHPLPPGLALKGTSILYDDEGNVREYWNKSKQDGRDPDEVVKLADPKRIAKLSTLYDQEGRVTQQWVSEKPEAAAQMLAWREAAEAMAEALPRAEPVQLVEGFRAADLMACYPVGDHHLGMLSWDKETGSNYDIRIGEAALRSAVDYLVGASPACEQAAVVFLGDFMHYDSFKAMTPTAGNILDADGRFPKMVRAAVRSMRYTIETAAAKHGSVLVIVEIGNHDLASSIFLMEALKNIYENDHRIIVDTSPSHYHYFEFGKCLVGTHHGHGPKPEKLPLIMANDRPEEWGRSQYRYWWTGHVHHDTTKDYTGCRVESFRILAPEDAWAAQKGYRSRRDMKSILLHSEYGEVARHIVTPAMFGSSPEEIGV